jgi:transposase
VATTRPRSSGRYGRASSNRGSASAAAPLPAAHATREVASGRRRTRKSRDPLARPRWPVERTTAWLKTKRRIATRRDRKADNHLAFLQLGVILILTRPLRDQLQAPFTAARSLALRVAFILRWRVESALRDQGIEYTRDADGVPKSRRTAVIAGTGQKKFPAIEFQDGVSESVLGCLSEC